MGRAGPRGQEGGAGPRGPQGAAGREERERPERGGSKGKGGKGRERRREAARRITGAATKPGGQLHNYQAIIAAEFVAAELLVALRPIATQKAQPTQSGGLSPYYVNDLIKLLAIGFVYLILEGLAAGPRGLARFVAWFGFLILIGVGLSEASNLAKIFAMLAGGGVSPIKLTGAQAPAVADTTAIPPLVPGGAPPGTTSGIPPAGIA